MAEGKIDLSKVDWSGTWKKVKKWFNNLFSLDWLSPSAKSAVAKGASTVGAIASTVNPPLGAVIGAYGSYLESDVAYDQKELEYHRQVEEAQKNRDFQTAEREASQEYNLELWEKQNEYNSDYQVAQRAMSAGRNLNSVFNQGTSYAQNAPYTQPMTGGVAQLPSGFGTALLTALSQNKLAEAQSRLFDKEAENVEEDTRSKEIENNYSSATFETRVKMLNDSSSQIDLQNKSILQSLGINAIDSSIRQAQYARFARMDDKQFEIQCQQLNHLRLEYLDVISQIWFREHQGNYYIALKSNIEQQTVNLEKEAVNIDKQGVILDKEASLLDERIETQKAVTNSTKEGAVGQYLENRIKQFEVAVSEVTNCPLGTPEYMLDFMLLCSGDYETYYTNMKLAAARTQAQSTDIHTFSKFASTTSDDAFKDYHNNRKGKGENKGKYVLPKFKSVLDKRNVTYSDIFNGSD